MVLPAPWGIFLPKLPRRIIVLCYEPMQRLESSIWKLFLDAPEKICQCMTTRTACLFNPIYSWTGFHLRLG